MLGGFLREAQCIVVWYLADLGLILSKLTNVFASAKPAITAVKYQFFTCALFVNLQIITFVVYYQASTTEFHLYLQKNASCSSFIKSSKSDDDNSSLLNSSRSYAGVYSCNGTIRSE